MDNTIAKENLNFMLPQIKEICSVFEIKQFKLEYKTELNQHWNKTA